MLRLHGSVNLLVRRSRRVATAASAWSSALPEDKASAWSSALPGDKASAWSSALPEDKASIKLWFDRWGDHVPAREFAVPREFFARDALGFGTWRDFKKGLDALEERQWKIVRPTTHDFSHRTEDSLQISVSPDRRMAVGLVLWTSTGFDEVGASFDRPGRTTAVLTRPCTKSAWQCVHTHVSLARGVPRQSFGSPSE